MRKSTAQPIAEVLKSVVGKLDQAKEKEICKIIEFWPQVAGKELARHTKPVQLHKKTLMVIAQESAWLYQANFYKQQLLESIKQKIGKDKVASIKFRIGEI